MVCALSLGLRQAPLLLWSALLQCVSRDESDTTMHRARGRRWPYADLGQHINVGRCAIGQRDQLVRVKGGRLVQVLGKAVVHQGGQVLA